MKDKIFEGVLLASDFDGTLTTSKGELLPCVIEAIKSFTDRGGLFTVSTGRTKQGFIAWDKVPYNAPVILGNGVQVYDYPSGKIIYEEAISKDVIPFLEALAVKFPDISIELYGTDFTTWCYHMDEISVEHLRWQNIGWTEIDSLTEAHYPLVKIMLSVKGNGDEVEEWVRLNHPDFITYLWNRGGFMEIFSTRAGKGNCLPKLAEYLGIRKENVYAAGDGLNDVDMLEAAHISFSPADSQENVLDHCDITVRDSDHGTIAHVIEILETFYS